MTQDKKRNQGEGDKRSARRFNKNEQDFVKKNADLIDRPVDAQEGDGEAEELGRSRAKDFDPAVARDNKKK